MGKILGYIHLSLTVFTLLAFGPVRTAAADTPPDYYGNIIVSSVWVSAAERGDESILQFMLTNDGPDSTHFLRVETPIAGDAKIMARVSEGESRVLDSIGIKADSDLNLTTSHLWIKLAPLLRDLSAGESISLELVFTDGRVPARAHVHSGRK